MRTYEKKHAFNRVCKQCHQLFVGVQPKKWFCSDDCRRKYWKEARRETKLTKLKKRLQKIVKQIEELEHEQSVFTKKS